MGKIRKYMSVYEILNKFPETIEVFASNGLGVFQDKKVLNDAGKFIKLNTVLYQKNINVDMFIEALETKINDTQKNKNQKYDEKIYERENLNILALLPCPLKVPLEKAFEQFIQNYQGENKTEINYCITSNANNQLSYYDYVDKFRSIDEVPDIIISPGLNGFFHKSFVDKFINTGHFVDVSDYVPNKVFKEIRYQDPKHNYSMIATNILVMAVDKEKLGDAPVPETWGDLLKKDYENKVAIRGNNKSNFCETVLTTFYKEYGLEGIKKLSRSVRVGWHPSQMVKSLNSVKSDGTAICVLPYFYSKMISNENVTVIWPRDGALVNPISLLVKRSKINEIKEISGYFAGKSFGQIFADAFFPAVNPEVNNKLPKGASLKWLGWDYINSNDMGELVKRVNKYFLDEFKPESREMD